MILPIKTWRPIPERGQRFFSVNLGLVALPELLRLIADWGLQPEIVQMPCRSGIQIHALLWKGEIADTPDWLEEKVDWLAGEINPDAIRFASGQWSQRTA